MASTTAALVAAVEHGLAHELADCRWSELVLARRLGVDLGASFVDTMNELESRLADQGLDGVWC